MVAAVNLDDVDPVLPDYDLIRLGSLEVSSVALDCSKWDGSDSSAFIAAVDGGVTLFDTHPNEMILGSWVNAWCVSEAAQIVGARPPVLSSTCHIPLDSSAPLTPEQVVSALEAHKVNTGGVGAKGLCQVTLDGPRSSWLACQLALAEGLKKAQDKGFCGGAIGVVGYGPRELEALASALGEGGPQLVSNRVRYSLLERGIEKDGTLATCRDLGVTVLAQGALAGGRLSKVPEGLETEEEGDIAGLLKLLQLVGSFIGGRTPTQVAVNWLVASGVVPVVATSDERHAWEVAGAKGWRLDDNQVELLGERAEMTVAYEASKQM